MLIGQSVNSPLSPTKASYVTPWFPRQGNSLTAIVEIMKAAPTTGSFSCTVTVQTKNKEQADSSAIALGGAVVISTIGATPIQRTGALELVRYTYQFSSTTSAQWVHMRANPPIWQPN